MAKEWVNKARNDAKSEINLRLETQKALGGREREE